MKKNVKRMMALAAAGILAAGALTGCGGGAACKGIKRSNRTACGNLF